MADKELQEAMNDVKMDGHNVRIIIAKLAIMVSEIIPLELNRIMGNGNEDK